MMQKLWFTLFYSLCAGCIVFSLLWLASPSVLFSADAAPAPERDEAPADVTASGVPETDSETGGTSDTVYYLCDRGGRVTVYEGDDRTTPTQYPEIYVNLLPEADALRLKQGFTVTGRDALEAVLEDLGA